SASFASAFATLRRDRTACCTWSPTRIKAPFSGSSRQTLTERRKALVTRQRSVRRSPLRRGGGVSSSHRQRHADLCAGVAVADVDSTVHRGRELADERKPDAGAGRRARKLVLGSIKELED